MAITYPITLSTTEPNNNIGLLKIRQSDEETQTLIVDNLANGIPLSYERLQVFFCAKIGQAAGLGIIEQKLTDAEMTDPKNGKLEYTFRPEDWQVLGRQTGYFSFRKMKDDHTYVQQFSTRDFTYEVTKSIYSEGIKEVKKDGSTYIWSFEDLLRLLEEFKESGESDFLSWYEEIKDQLSEDAAGNLMVLYQSLRDKTGEDSDFRPFEKDESFMKRVFNEQSERGLNAKWYGAVGDGETNDLLAIREMFSVAEPNSTIIFPPTEHGYFLENDDLDYLFKIDKPLIIEGMGSYFKLSKNIPNTVDVFKITPGSTDQTARNYVFQNITITGEGAHTPARHAFNVDLSAEGSYLANAIFNHNKCYRTGGYSFNLTNPESDTGFFISVIEKNLFFSGVKLQRCGDSVSFVENTCAGDNKVDISLISGSNTFLMQGNNVTAKDGLIIRSGHNIKILNNNFEIGYAGSAPENGAYIDIDGSDVSEYWGLLMTEFRGNNITYRSEAPDGIDALRINKARNTFIEGNHIAKKNSKLLNITANAQETIVGVNILSSGTIEDDIIDNGRNTIRTFVSHNSKSGANEIYQAVSKSKLKFKSTIFHTESDSNLHETKSAGSNAGEDLYIWNEANSFNTKHFFKTQKRLSSGSLDESKQAMWLGDGYVGFPNGIVLIDSSGFRWLLKVSTAGAISATRMT